MVELDSSVLYTKIQSRSFLGYGEDDFQEFLSYMDMAAILFSSAEPFEQIGNTLSIEGLCEIWREFLKRFQSRRYFIITKLYTKLYTCV